MSRDSVPFEHPWDEALLGDVADVIVGGTPSTAIHSFWGGSIPWMASGDVHLHHVQDVAGRITESGLRYSNAVMVDPPAIAMALAGQGKTRGTVALTHIPLCTNQSVALIKPDDKQLDPVFLFQSLIPRYEEMRSRSAGGGRAGLTKAIIEKTPVQLPPPPQQRKIARILTTVDNQIEKTEALIAKHQAIKQGMMHDLFTRGVDEHGHLRPPYEEAPELYKPSELGWIPKEWEVIPARHYCHEITKGATPPEMYDEAGFSNVPFIRVQNLSFDGTLLFNDQQLFIPAFIHQTSLVRSKVFPGDVLMNLVGPPMGKVSLIPKTFPEWNINQAIAIFRTLDATANQYLSHFLLSQFAFKWFISRAKRTSGQTNLTLEMCRQLPVPNPNDVNERIRMTGLLNSADIRLVTENAVQKKLQRLKTGLMQDLLTGKVRVKVDEAEEAVHV